MTHNNVPNGRLFEDKLDYLACLLEIAQICARVEAGKRVVCFVEDDFFKKLGFRIPVAQAEFVECPANFDTDLIDYTGDEVFAIYAIQHSSIGIPVAKRLIDRKIKFAHVGGHKVGGFVFDDHVARSVIENSFVIHTLQGFAKFHDPGASEDLVNLCQALLYTNRLEGDVVEVGCFRGCSGAVMLDYAHEKGLAPKTFHFFDVFSGFDYPEALSSSDSTWANTHKTEGMQTVAARLTSRAAHNNVHVETVNIISDPIPPSVTKISLCNIDVDLYEAVHAALFRLAPLIVKGGIMICEDAGHTPALIGARVALEEFIQSDMGAAFTPVHQSSGQVFLVRHG